MTIEEKRRALFEVKISEALIADGCNHESVQSVIERGSDGGYRSIRVAGAWEGFNLALDAVEIELPVIARPIHAGAEWLHAVAQDEYRAKVTAAIESTGLGLKVKP